jgi:hypothetical protein
MTGLPEGVNFSLGPRQSAVSILPQPQWTNEVWRIAVIRIRNPGGAEALVMKAFAKIGWKYPIASQVEQVIEPAR